MPTTQTIVLTRPVQQIRVLVGVVALVALFEIPFPVASLRVGMNSVPYTSSPSTLSNSTRSTYTGIAVTNNDVMTAPPATSLSEISKELPRPEPTALSPQPSQQTRRRLCVMVEPSPFTYISGYANRFQQLLQYLQSFHNSTYQVDVITTEVVEVSNPLPTTFNGDATATATTPIPIHYCSGIRLPFYPTMSVVSPYFSKNNIGSILRRNIHTQRPSQEQSTKALDLIHVSSPGFMIFYAIFYSRYYSIPLLISYHTHLPIYIRSYIPYKIISPIVQWIGTH